MKKAITIITICLFTFVGTQTTQAQTKEETIAWIKEKMKTNKELNTIHVNVSPCNVSWYEYYEFSNERYEFNPSAAIWSVDEDGHSIRASAKVIKSLVGDPAGEYKEQIIKFYFTKDTVLLKQMAVALNHLATFCEEGKK